MVAEESLKGKIPKAVRVVMVQGQMNRLVGNSGGDKDKRLTTVAGTCTVDAFYSSDSKPIVWFHGQDPGWEKNHANADAKSIASVGMIMDLMSVNILSQYSDPFEGKKNYDESMIKGRDVSAWAAAAAILGFEKGKLPENDEAQGVLVNLALASIPPSTIEFKDWLISRKTTGSCVSIINVAVRHIKYFGRFSMTDKTRAMHAVTLVNNYITGYKSLESRGLLDSSKV
jgi:hypothetical protein